MSEAGERQVSPALELRQAQAQVEKIDRLKAKARDLRLLTMQNAMDAGMDTSQVGILTHMTADEVEDELEYGPG